MSVEPAIDHIDDPDIDRTHASTFFVGIGASAGGLEAVSTMVQNLSHDANAIYILAQHISPTHTSLLTTLISRETTLPVVEIADGIKPVTNTIYITPPNADVILEEGKLRLMDPSSHTAGPKPSADRLFQSLANQMGELCVGVVLSGTGSDGSYGVQAIREAGGITIAQDPKNAKYDGMPRAAIETGCCDLTLSADHIGQHLSKILSSPHNFDHLRHLSERPTKLTDLFQILLASTGVDFRDYKESTINRRINRRMTALEIDDYEAYVAYCRRSGAEVEALYRDLLISVTRFFRDQSQFEKLRQEFDRIVAEQRPNQMRLWVAGCATGEEVYSIAAVLIEALGGLKQLKTTRVQIFATDIDDRALEVARRGSYPITAAADIPEPYLSKYFSIREERVEALAELRSITLFSMHNMFQDPPFLNLDFISVRNVLIYFNPALQNRVLHRMQYALSAEGLLFLGNSETVGNLDSLFEARSGSDKIFSKRAQAARRAPSFSMTGQTLAIGSKGPGRAEKEERAQRSDVAQFDTLARAVAPNGFIATRSGEMVRVFGDISHLTRMTEDAPLWIGIRNLRKPLGDEIQGLLATTLKAKQQRAGNWHDMEGSDFDQARCICYPLVGNGEAEDTVLVALETRKRQSKPDVYDAMNDADRSAYVKQMEVEVSDTREALQQTVEELQTSNEELQSINEEMQSTNEELQATNEELETSNEELQSTNEELITVNEELQVNSSELLNVTTELTATLEAVPFPMLVVDHALIVRRASQSAMDTFHIGPLPKTGMHLSQCTLPEEIADLASLCSDVFRYHEERTSVFTEGSAVKLVTVTPFENQSGDVLGVIVTVANDISSGEAVDLLQKFGSIGHWQLDLSTNALFWSDEVFRIHGRPPQQGVPPLDEAIAFYHPDDRDQVSKAVQACIETGEAFLFTLRLLRPDGQTVMVESAGKRYASASGRAMRIVGIFRDVTEKTRELTLLNQLQVLKRDRGHAFYSYDLVNGSPYWSDKLFGMLGRDKAEYALDMRDAIDMFHHDDRAIARQAWQKALETDNPSEFTARAVHADGNIIECTGQFRSSHDSSGTATHVFGTIYTNNAY